MRQLVGFFARKAKDPPSTIIHLKEPHVIPVTVPEWFSGGDRLTLTFGADMLKVGGRPSKRVLVTGIVVTKIDTGGADRDY